MDSMRSVLHVWLAGYPAEVRVGKINRALVAAGVNVSVLSRARPGEHPRAFADGVMIRRVGARLPSALSLPVPGNPFWRETLRATVAETRPELILVREIPVALAAADAARRAGAKIVLDMAEHYPEAMRSWRKYSRGLPRLLVHRLRLPDRLERAVVERVDGIVVVCDEQKARLVEEYRVSPDRICVAMNTPEPSKAPRTTRRRAPAAFGYHGNLSADRDLPTVLAGFDRAAERDAAITLHVAGGGESEDELRGLHARMRHRARVRLTGRYALDDLPTLYRESDYGIVALQANPFTEHTVANKLFDYAALGMPFVHSDVGPVTRISRQIGSGVPFDAGSAESAARAFLALRKMDYRLLSKKGATAVARRFNWGVDGKRLVEFLASIVG
jgi:glycosyltransferase involved in cell wall biosynthesis